MKHRLERDRSPDTQSADKSRRSFFWKMGAGASAALASTAGVAGTETGHAGDLSLRVALLEDEKALRELHRAFEQAIDDGRYEDVVAMFAADARVVFNGGVFDGRSGGVARLYSERFRSRKSGGRMAPAPGFELDAERRRDNVEVSADRLSATAVFPYSIRMGAPIESDSSLADMARLQGEGVRSWWEGGLYQVTYARNAADGRWTIRRLEYDTLARADYRPGRSHATPISVPRIAARFPNDPQGPDALV